MKARRAGEPGEGVRLAVLGATGLVGRRIVELLEERRFPVAELVPLASDRGGQRRAVAFRGGRVPVAVARPEAFDGVHLVLASAGREAAAELLPEAARRGAICVDNSSAFRLDPRVPLVVPEVNPQRVTAPPRGIIANPNCTTIQLVVVLKPLLDAVGLRRVLVASYQSVSGAGGAALAALRRQTRRRLDGSADGEAEPDADSPPFDADCLPWIGGGGEDGDSGEERKVRRESRKILESEVAIHATCVRVPVEVGHGEAVWIETGRALDPRGARELLARAPGVVVAEEGDPPTPRRVAGDGRVHAGRIRRDPSTAHGLALWIVADNLLKGAALNAVQIAEELVARGCLASV